jgi:hypothetical protein
MSATAALRVFSPSGRPIGDIREFDSLKWSHAVNAIGQFDLVMAGQSDLVFEDGSIVALVRDMPGKEAYLEFAGVVEEYHAEQRTKNEQQTWYIGGTCGNGYLALRNIPLIPGQSGAVLSGTPADNAIKGLVRSHIGELASATRQEPLLSVEANESMGPAVSATVSLDQLWDALTNIQADSRLITPEVHFRVIPTLAGSSIIFRLVTGANYLGRDTRNNVLFSLGKHNLDNPKIGINYSGSATTFYYNKALESVSYTATGYFVLRTPDGPAPERSVPRRREALVSTVSDGTSARRTGRARAALARRAPRPKFTGTILSVPGSLYGWDWWVGDYIRVHYGNYVIDTVVRATFGEIRGKDETITGVVDAEVNA